MSTFKEICESVLEEANGRPVTLSSVNLGKNNSGIYYITDPTQRNVIRWVQEIYLQIQQRMIQATFMHRRGSFLTLQIGREEYPKSNVREVDRYSLYAIQAGTTGRIPVIFDEYDNWKERKRAEDSSSGAPLWLVRSPNEDWIIYPTPTAVWTLYGDWWREPCEFQTASEEPIWAQQYHALLKWKVLALFASEFAEEGIGGILHRRILEMLPWLENTFERRYMPTIRGPDSLI